MYIYTLIHIVGGKGPFFPEEVILKLSNVFQKGCVNFYSS